MKETYRVPETSQLKGQGPNDSIKNINENFQCAAFA
jgi:hypothetical protein